MIDCPTFIPIISQERFALADGAERARLLKELPPVCLNVSMPDVLCSLAYACVCLHVYLFLVL